MVTLVIPLPDVVIKPSIPLADIMHYCGAGYHVGWLRGMGYVATNVLGAVHRKGVTSPLHISCAVSEDDELEYVYDQTAANPINLWTVSPADEPEHPPRRSKTAEAVVATRDPACVFNGCAVPGPLRSLFVLPAKLQAGDLFNAVRERLGLSFDDIRALPNLLRVFNMAHDALTVQQAAILATDDRFVPLAHMPHNSKIDPSTGGLFFQHIGTASTEWLDFTKLPHQAAAAFPLGAAREAYHYVYWGRMLLRYLDEPAVRALTGTPDEMVWPAESDSDGEEDPSVQAMGFVLAMHRATIGPEHVEAAREELERGVREWEAGVVRSSSDNEDLEDEGDQASTPSSPRPYYQIA